MSNDKTEGLDLAAAAASAGVADFKDKNIDVEKTVERSGVKDWMKSWNVVWTCDKWSEDACDFARRKLGFAPGADVSSALLRTIMIPDLGVEEKYGNVLLDAGVSRLLQLLIQTITNSTIQSYDATHTRVGVGDGNASAVSTQTDLNGTVGNSDHRAWSLVTAANVISGSPAKTVTATSDFASTLGNFAWLEWGIDGGTATTVYSAGAGSNVAVSAANNSTAGTPPMLNRKQESLVQNQVAPGLWLGQFRLPKSPNSLMH